MKNLVGDFTPVTAIQSGYSHNRTRRESSKHPLQNLFGCITQLEYCNLKFISVLPISDLG
jgi:hypothetical protein